MWNYRNDKQEAEDEGQARSLKSALAAAGDD